VRRDGGGFEAEVIVVLGDLLVDGALFERNGGEGDLGSVGRFEGEKAAVDVVEGGGGNLVVVGGDELHADLVEVERGVGVVGDDDADGDEGVADVGEAEEVAVGGFSAGVDGDGDVIGGVGDEGGIFGGGTCRGSLLCEGERRGCEEAEGN
jgi:hypothetical protein